jgi:SEC-C motif-containing protein
MRSRYSAYALGLVTYIIETTVPLGPQWNPDLAYWTESLKDYCSGSHFTQLTVLDAPTPSTSSLDEGEVRFEATVTGREGDLSFSERSRFLRIAGRWLYHSGKPGS